MKRDVPGYEENLRKAAEKLLQDLSAVDDFTKSSDFLLESDTSEELRRDELVSVENSVWAKKDGSCAVRVSPDSMTCTADFYSPSPDGNFITLEAVQDKLLNLDVVYGVDWDIIGESILACNTEGRDILDVVIAKGTSPVDEEPARFALHERFLEREVPPEDIEKSVDFRERTPFVLVRKGDLLAVEVPLKTGSTGSDIKGNTLFYGMKLPESITGRKNTETVKGGIIAAIDGMAKTSGTEVWVEEVLHVRGNVDYHTGHIDFPGDIIIEGHVADDFRVHSGGSVFCKTTLNASDVKAKGDLVVKGGIIGRSGALVSAAGKVNAKFLERCNLEAGGDVHSEVGAINSVVQTLGKFSASLLKGMIIGGKIYAQNGVEVYNIGTPSSPKTEIICGINHQVLRKLEWIKDKNFDFALQLREVKKSLDFSSVSRSDLLDLKDNLLKGIHKLNEAARILVNQLTKNEAARVVVFGEVVPGTYIEICNVSYIVNKPLRKVSFFLNKELGRIEVAAIKRR